MSRKKATDSAMRDKKKEEAEFSRKQQEEEERSRDMEVTSGNAAARMAAYHSQVGEIQEAEGRARTRGISTTGKTVGTQSLASSALSGAGSTVADIGIDENIEADELDPNLVRTRSGFETLSFSVDPVQTEQSAPVPDLTPEEQQREWERTHSLDYDLEL